MRFVTNLWDHVESWISRDVQVQEKVCRAATFFFFFSFSFPFFFCYCVIKSMSFFISFLHLYLVWLLIEKKKKEVKSTPRSGKGVFVFASGAF